MKKELPFFKYHPNPLKTGAFKTGKNVVCNCCGKETDVYYTRPFYSVENIEYLCPECIVNGEVRIGGNDFSFSIPYDLPFDEKDYEYEISQIPKEVRDKVIPIVETGWHIGGTLWIDDKGNFYHTLYYRNDSMEKYNSIFDYLEYNFRHYLGNEIYVTFKNQRDLENNRY